MNNHYRFLMMPRRTQAEDFEPFLSSEDVNIHRDRIYADCTDKLNISLDGYEYLHGMTCEQLLTCGKLPRESKEDILHYAGGYYAHSVFFSSLLPCVGGIRSPKGEFLNKIKSEFRSTEGFLYELKNVALSLRGEGFAWVLSDRGGNILMTATSCNEVPDLRKYYVLFCIDMWEHSYFGRYRDCRHDYIDTIMKLTDFPIVSERYEQLLGI